MCLAVTYSVENDVCGVTLNLSSPGKLKNMLDHGGNRTYDLWKASPMLYQLSYGVRSVRVRDILELSLVLSIAT